MPVTTPMAKLMRNSFPKNLVRRRYASSPERYQRVWKYATVSPNPMVRGTIQKWYTVVIPNCHRERLTTSMAAVPSLGAAGEVSTDPSPKSLVQIEHLVVIYSTDAPVQR